MAVGRKGQIDAIDLADPIKGIEKGLEGIGQVRHAADMWRDRRQDVVSREERAGLWIM